MPYPRLTFFCELDTDSLRSLFDDAGLVEDLKLLEAGISLGLIDLTSERASIVRKLNEAGVPVTAWLLLPHEQGYWFNVDNLPHAERRYQDFIAWTEENDLVWAGVGLDIEPDIRDMTQLMEDRLSFFSKLLNRVFNRKRLKQAETGYQALVSRISSDGYYVESYQIPIIEDERKAGSTLLRRLGGLVDLQVDREVWMLYSSILRPYGVGVLGSYAPHAQAIGIGVTGGGVDIEFVDAAPLTWEELARDLRLAWYWCDDIYIFSLEGCVNQGYLNRMKTFQWDQPMMIPEKNIGRMETWRGVLRSGLWLSAHLWGVLIAVVGVILFIQIIKRLMKHRWK